jgi:pimeloyl-ACP methyl ester carboxylesterase
MTQQGEVADRVIDVGPVELTVTEAGVGGRPLLLVHGYTGSRGDFADFVGLLAGRGWHVVAPDLRGHGQSTKPDQEAAYSLATFGGDVLALADALGWDRFVLLGHSMGGMIAQVVVTGAPERVVALVLMDTGHGRVPIDPALVELGVTTARDQGMDVIADFLATMEDDPLTTEAYRRKVAEDPAYGARGDRNLRASAPAMYAAMMLELTSAADRLDSLRAVAVPTLVLVGSQDTPFLEPSRAMADAIAGAELVVVDGGGHSPQFEAPDGWWLALSGFLDRVAAETLA